MNNESLPEVQDSMSTNKEESALDVGPQVPAQPVSPATVAVPGAVLPGLEMGLNPATNRKACDKSKAETIKAILEISGKMLIGLAGLCYVLGLIVVTIHLRQYGLNSLDLPQLHYVTAGVWTVLPIVLMVLLILFAFYMVVSQAEELKRKKGVDKLAGIFSAIVAVLILSYLGLGFLGSEAGIEFGWTNWVWVPLLGLTAVWFVVLPGGLLTQPDTYRDRKFLILMLGVLVVGIVLSMFYVVLFATHTYEAIPWSTGGGRSSQVRLVVAPDSRPYFESVGIKFSDGENRTDSLKLLLVTEKEFILTNSDGMAISVPAASVKSVLYEK